MYPRGSSSQVIFHNGTRLSRNTRGYTGMFEFQGLQSPNNRSIGTRNHSDCIIFRKGYWGSWLKGSVFRWLAILVAWVFWKAKVTYR